MSPRQQLNTRYSMQIHLDVFLLGITTQAIWLFNTLQRPWDYKAKDRLELHSFRRKTEIRSNN